MNTFLFKTTPPSGDALLVSVTAETRSDAEAQIFEAVRQQFPRGTSVTAITGALLPGEPSSAAAAQISRNSSGAQLPTFGA